MLDGNEHKPLDSGAALETILDFIAGRPPGGPTVAPPSTAPAPSARETEVLRLLAEGEANKVIARRLGIGLATAERHVAAIYRKIGARGWADAALHAVVLGLAALPQRPNEGFPAGANGGIPGCG